MTAQLDAQTRRTRIATTAHDLPDSLDLVAAYCAATGSFGESGAVLLESLNGSPEDSRFHCLGFDPVVRIAVTDQMVSLDGQPLAVARWREHVEVAGHGLLDAWMRLQQRGAVWQLLRQIQHQLDADPPEVGPGCAFVAFLAYEAGRYVENLPELIDETTSVPDIELRLYSSMVVQSTITGQTTLLQHTSAYWECMPADEVTDLLVSADRPGETSAAAPEEWQDDQTRGDYLERAETCKEYIRNGDIYQVQLGHKITNPSDLPAVQAYLRLRERNPSPYMYLAPLGSGLAIGASPELFIRIEDGHLVMRPIAGTAPRPEDPVGEAKQEHALACDPKEIAEHVMLVDLCRNDVGRVSRPGTLSVPQLMRVEKYSHVLHLVSTVSGDLEPGQDAWDAIAATFPAGTMTGAPKRRAMEVIEEQEVTRRGVYAGALGLVSLDGSYLNLALCIRTLVRMPHGYETRASAGIVAGSSPAAEWRETQAKTAATVWAVSGEGES